MGHAVVGWEEQTPAPDHRFTEMLFSRDGQLHFGGLNLAQLFLPGQSAVEGADYPGLGKSLASPLEIVYLPSIRRQIHRMTQLFAEVSAEVGYSGRFLYAYASKANAAEEVVRTTLGAGAHHEMSSTVDVEIVRLMLRRGLLPADRLVICNGYKGAGSDYAANIIRLRQEHEQLIPVIDDPGELAPLVESGRTFRVGLRQKCYGNHLSQTEMDAAHSRFGMRTDELLRTARAIDCAANLEFAVHHFMVGSQVLGRDGFVNRLRPGIEIYARLKQEFSSLTIFDFGGGMPARMTLDFSFDYRSFVRQLLTTIQEICARHGVEVPDVMGEFGRYTTCEHGAHLFEVVTVKENGSAAPWYIIDGSIMTSFPDAWALGEHFIVLPLTHLDKPFRRVQLGGITCDSDDVYPPKGSASPLYLPVETENLYLGFFGIGAYQEMLGGVRGSKHCVLPEAGELIVDQDEQERYQFELLPGQSTGEVLRNLGYRVLGR